MGTDDLGLWWAAFLILTIPFSLSLSVCTSLLSSKLLESVSQRRGVAVAAQLSEVHTFGRFESYPARHFSALIQTPPTHNIAKVESRGRARQSGNYGHLQEP